MHKKKKKYDKRLEPLYLACAHLRAADSLIFDFTLCGSFIPTLDELEMLRALFKQLRRMMATSMAYSLMAEEKVKMKV